MGSIDKACICGFLCRLCSEMHRIVIHIYGDQGKRLCLVEKINGYLPITISPSDPLPKTICESCLRRVEQHYDLLMRLTRIKAERFMTATKRPLPDVSSSDLSEEDIFNTNNNNNSNNNNSNTNNNNSDEDGRSTRLRITAHGMDRTCNTTSNNINNGNMVNQNRTTHDEMTPSSSSSASIRSHTELMPASASGSRSGMQPN